jgi:hypothetical protein
MSGAAAVKTRNVWLSSSMKGNRNAESQRKANEQVGGLQRK